MHCDWLKNCFDSFETLKASEIFLKILDNNNLFLYNLIQSAAIKLQRLIPFLVQIFACQNFSTVLPPFYNFL